MWIVWLFVSVIGLWLVLVWAFSALMHAKAIIERGEELHWFFKWPHYVLYWIGVPLDVAFNWTAGCVIYKELFRKWTFTSRCKYWKGSTTSAWRSARARWWCTEMSKFDKGHC